MKILVIGQMSMEKFRIEFGNIGNYYIIEPFFRMLHKTFPNSVVNTTLQLSERFCKDENVNCLSLSLYYNLDGGNKQIVEKEIDIAEEFKRTGVIKEKTPYIEEVLESDLIIDFSGDIWGANANLLNKDRFYVGVAKDYVAQLLGKYTALFASSPGPFDKNDHFEFAKKVFECFDFVANREAESKKVLDKYGFNTLHVNSYACPAFLFEGKQPDEKIREKYIRWAGKKTVGFILSGFNFEKGPHNLWPRGRKDYINFLQLIEHIINNREVNVCLMSHSNGFKLPPHPFIQIHGSDYKHVMMLKKILVNKGYSNKIRLVDEILSPWEIKGLIGNFDLLISGRIHGAVAGFSQDVPTVVIDYGHEPKAHKTKGFVKVVERENSLVDPRDLSSMKLVVDSYLNNLSKERSILKKVYPKIKNSIIRSYEDLRNSYFNSQSQKR